AGNFFSYKKFPNRARENSLADFPFKRRLNDKGLSSAAACDQRRRLWKLPPFEKGGRKLLFFTWQPKLVLRKLLRQRFQIFLIPKLDLQGTALAIGDDSHLSAHLHAQDRKSVV